MPGKTDARLILASSSPRRRQLLRDGGYDFEVVGPPFGEPADHPDRLLPSQHAEALAYFKAMSVWQSYPQRPVLGADTVVAAGGEILGKPADRDEAVRMLRGLSGTRHSVITGVALLGPDDRRLIASDVTFVTMRPMSEREIDEYIESGEWAGKAGAYAIQETADRFIESTDGSFTNVIGLPMELVERMLRELREHPEVHRTP